MPTQVFLFFTNGTSGSWPDPGNWNPSANVVECVGPGGLGAPAGNFSGGGGGGGAYARTNNMSLTFPVPYVVGGPGLASNFGTNNANYTPTGNVVSAISGGSGSNSSGIGGNGGLNFYPSGFGGGNGGNSTSFSGGGGGAGGPHGAGATGVSGTGSVNGAGGAADGGIVPGGAAGAPGNSGTTWDLSHGVGSGGGGGSGTNNAGGNYGGGGGGSNNVSSFGGQGIIVLTYLPLGATQVFILPAGSGGSGTFPDPGNWNPSNNKVEVIGCGGNGSGYNGMNPNGGGGGGGGAYAYATNMALTFPVPYYLFGPNSSGQGFACNFGINSSASQSSGPVVSARNGSDGNSSGGGGPGGGVGSPAPWPNGFVGGNGGNWAVAGQIGGGGGGAGGPHGAGGNGGVGGAGGAGDGGVTPIQLTNSAAGRNGTQFNPWSTLPNGSGGGGAGASTTTGIGGNGGNYGGGGGGAYNNASSTQGHNVGGIIVLTYTPFSLATQVGIVRYWQTSSPGTKYMWMTIIPTYDSELDNPSWTSNILTGATGWSWDMVRIPLTQYMGYANFAAFQTAVLAM